MFSIRHLACAAALAVSILPIVTQAEDEEPKHLLPYDLSITLGLVSDYSFFGISQTGGEPALQASIDWKPESGVYAGIWTSNVDFEDHSNAKQELDFYAGYNHDIGKLNTDVSLLHVRYFSPKSGYDFNYTEAKLALSHPIADLFSLTGEARYSPDYAGNSGDEEYLQAGVSVPLPHDLTFAATYGRQWIEKNANYGYPDYNNWKAGFAYNYSNFDFGLNYTDTNLTKDECADNCDARVIFSVARTF